MSHLVEIFQALEKTSMHLGEHIDVLQQGIVTVCMEFTRMFPEEEIAEASLEQSPVNSSTESQPEHLQPVVESLEVSSIESIYESPTEIPEESMTSKSKYPDVLSPAEDFFIESPVTSPGLRSPTRNTRPLLP